MCTHPDHNDQKTCEDRAVGCSSNCVCCLGPTLFGYVREESEEN